MRSLELPCIPIARIPWLTSLQMRQVDDWMEREYNIELLQMMENAGRLLARLVLSLFPDACHQGIAVAAGSGGNGGGVLVAARRLHNRGCPVQVLLTRPLDQMTSVPARQADILQRMGLKLTDESELCVTTPALWLDGLLGYSLRGNARDIAAQRIDRLNRDPAPVISLDLPSGLDPDGLYRFSPVVDATATLTLALPKTGLLDGERETLRPEVGKLFVGDIGVPPELYPRALQLEVHDLFQEDELVAVAASG